MTLEKKVFVDKLEILPEQKIVQVRTATVITDNGSISGGVWVGRP